MWGILNCSVCIDVVFVGFLVAMADDNLEPSKYLGDLRRHKEHVLTYAVLLPPSTAYLST